MTRFLVALVILLLGWFVLLPSNGQAAESEIPIVGEIQQVVSDVSDEVQAILTEYGLSEPEFIELFDGNLDALVATNNLLQSTEAAELFSEILTPISTEVVSADGWTYHKPSKAQINDWRGDLSVPEDHEIVVCFGCPDFDFALPEYDFDSSFITENHVGALITRGTVSYIIVRPNVDPDEVDLTVIHELQHVVERRREQRGQSLSKDDTEYYAYNHEYLWDILRRYGDVSYTQYVQIWMSEYKDKHTDVTEHLNEMEFNVQKTSYLN